MTESEPITTPNPTRFVVSTCAGVVPGEAEDDFTRTWTVSAQQWESNPENTRLVILAEVTAQAQGYAMLLMLQPDRFNWVKTEWVWF